MFADLHAFFTVCVQAEREAWLLIPYFVTSLLATVTAVEFLFCAAVDTLLAETGSNTLFINALHSKSI
jgi:hypothetical protein